MQAGLSPARPARARHRHELRTLTYVTLDQSNGGIIRNLTHEGIAVQAVAAVRPRQQLLVRFELRNPRLRMETRGEVMWATPSGRCGIRFLDVSPRATRQINEWIFGSLLEGMPRHDDPSASVFAESGFVVKAFALNAAERAEDEADGLMVSAAAVQVIEVALRPEPPAPDPIRDESGETQSLGELDWLSQPLSGRGLAWTVNTLVVLAALLLFALVFLSVTREPPHWPFALAAGATFAVSALYWGFFKLLAGGSPGARLARLRESGLEDDEEARDARFR
jgi:hypothetical protein